MSADGEGVVFVFVAQAGACGQGDGLAGAAEQYGQAQGGHGKPHGGADGQFGHFFQVAALAEHQGGEDLLLLAGKSGHVGLPEDVGGVLVVGGIGDVGADFVHEGGPAQVLLPVLALFFGFAFGEHVEELGGEVGHALGLVWADVVALLEVGDGLLAHVFVELAPDEVVEHAVAQGGVGYGHAVDIELGEYGAHHGQPAGEYFDAVGLHAVEFGFFGAAGFNQAGGDFLQGGGGDAVVFGIGGGDEVAQGAGGAGSAHGQLPAGVF